MNYTVLLYYRYVSLPDPPAERQAQSVLCGRLGLKGRILLGAEGINGTLAGTTEAIDEYLAYMETHPQFSGIEYKVDRSSTLPFPKLKVRVRDEIVTLGVSVDLGRTATHITPDEFDQLITDPEVILFDARNNYESAIGKFKGAITPNIALFKELPGALKDYEDLKDKTIVTYCTGGIRCEKASALMKQQGFKHVYQLEGGIINYAQERPRGAFEGECFVFDDRMSVAFDDNPKLMGECRHCSAPTNSYANCSYKPCNNLFLLCADCRTDAPACRAECRQALAGPVKVGA